MATTSIIARLGLDTASFERGMKSAQGALGAFRKAVGGLGGMLGFTAIGAIAKQAIDAGSAITDMAVATRTGIEELQALNYAAKLAGASEEQMANLLVRVQKSAADAARGLSTAKDAFTLLGISSDEFIKLSPERMLEQVGIALKNANGDTRAYGAALDLLGTRNAPKLMEVLDRLGVEGFDALAQKAKDAGQVMSEEMAKSLDDAGDSIELFKNRVTIFAGWVVAKFKTVGETIGESLGEAIYGSAKEIDQQFFREQARKKLGTRASSKDVEMEATRLRLDAERVAEEQQAAQKAAEERQAQETARMQAAAASEQAFENQMKGIDAYVKKTLDAVDYIGIAKKEMGKKASKVEIELRALELRNEAEKKYYETEHANLQERIAKADKSSDEYVKLMEQLGTLETNRFKDEIKFEEDRKKAIDDAQRTILDRIRSLKDRAAAVVQASRDKLDDRDPSKMSLQELANVGRFQAGATLQASNAGETAREIMALERKAQEARLRGEVGGAWGYDNYTQQAQQKREQLFRSGMLSSADVSPETLDKIAKENAAGETEKISGELRNANKTLTEIEKAVKSERAYK